MNNESMDLYKKLDNVVKDNSYTSEITNRSTSFMLKINIPNLIKGIEEYANVDIADIEVSNINFEDKIVLLDIHFNYDKDFEVSENGN